MARWQRAAANGPRRGAQGAEGTASAITQDLCDEVDLLAAFLTAFLVEPIEALAHQVEVKVREVLIPP